MQIEGTEQPTIPIHRETVKNPGNVGLPPHVLKRILGVRSVKTSKRYGESIRTRIRNTNTKEELLAIVDEARSLGLDKLPSWYKTQREISNRRIDLSVKRFEELRKNYTPPTPERIEAARVELEAVGGDITKIEGFDNDGGILK